MSALTIDDIKDKTVVMIGSTAGYLSSKQLSEKLARFNVTIKTTFTKGTTVAFYNPSQVTGDKISKAKNLGIKMFTYDEVKTFVDQLSDNSKTPSVEVPADSLKPLVRGEYLGTKPYYFKNITPVLEYGSLPPSQKYYSGSGYFTLNRALQGTNGDSLEELIPKERQFLEDLILLIQVKGKHYPMVYRGVSNFEATRKYFEMNVGDTVIKEGFMSTSLSENVALFFATWDSDIITNPSVMLYFEAPSNVKGLLISNMGEKEVLFPPRSGFTITKIEDHDIDIREATNKYIRRRRKIYSTLFIDPAFRTLNTSGKFIKLIS